MISGQKFRVVYEILKLQTNMDENKQSIKGLGANLVGLVGQVQALRQEMKKGLDCPPPETEPIEEGPKRTPEISGKVSTTSEGVDHTKPEFYQPLFYKQSIDKTVRGSVIIEMAPEDGWKTFKRIDIRPCLAAAGLIYDQEGDRWTEKPVPEASMPVPAPAGNKPVLNDDGDMV